MEQQTIAQRMLEEAIACGAHKAVSVSQKQIILSQEFRTICKGNGCGNYGQCWMCPPDVGEIESLMREVRRYPEGLLYQTIGRLEDSYDIEGMTQSAENHMQVSLRLQRRAKVLLTAEPLHVSCGGCHLCERCAKRDHLPCRHPELALPSMEAYGVDVYNTACNAGLQYCNGQNTVTFFGMVLWGV